MNASPDLSMAAIKMVLTLVMVLILLWIALRWARRHSLNNYRSSVRSLVKIIENRYVGGKKSIAVVQVPGALLVIGLGSDRITLLTKIDKPEILSDIETHYSAGKPLSFGDHIKRLTGKN